MATTSPDVTPDCFYNNNINILFSRTITIHTHTIHDLSHKGYKLGNAFDVES